MAVTKEELFAWLKKNYGTVDFFKSLAGAVITLKNPEKREKSLVGIKDVLFVPDALPETSEPFLFGFYCQDFHVTVTKFEVKVVWMGLTLSEREMYSLFEFEQAVF